MLQWKAGCWVSLAGSQAFTSAWEKYGRRGQVFAYLREKGGDERVGAVVSAIPGAGQFL